MITIPILYSAQLPSLEASADAVTGQSGTLQIRFTFSEDWDAYPRRTAMFISKAAARPVLLNEEGCAIVPASVIPHGVSILRISVFGNAEDESGNTVRYNGAPLTLHLRSGGQVLPDDCREITAYEQLLARVSDLDSSLATSMDWISSSAQLADACSRDAQNAQKAAALSEENAAESLRLLTDLKEEISEILQLESALQITEIRNAAAEQKEEIAAADAVLYTAQNRNEKEKAAARGNISAAAIIPLTASGVSFTAENTASAPVLGLRLFGNSTENITETVTVSISGQAYPIPVSGGLRGIRTASGGNYIDADGQDWICDELDFARGVYIQRIDSSENSIIPQPEETPLREDQLAVFRTMKTDSPAAAAANDSGLFMELTYAADTKLYVDRKDAEIEHSLKETLDALKESGELNVGGIDVTGAKVGQTVKIAEVDAEGKPTKWLPVYFPVGDGNGGTVEIDPTFAVSGAAADAKAVGDALSSKAGVTSVPNSATVNADNELVMQHTDGDAVAELFKVALPASGNGGGEWELIQDVTLTEDVAEVSLGNGVSYKDVAFVISPLKINNAAGDGASGSTTSPKIYTGYTYALIDKMPINSNTIIVITSLLHGGARVNNLYKHSPNNYYNLTNGYASSYYMPTQFAEGETTVSYAKITTSGEWLLKAGCRLTLYGRK